MMYRCIFILLISISFIPFGFTENIKVIDYNALVAIPKYDYTLGQAIINDEDIIYKYLALKKGKNIFIIRNNVDQFVINNKSDITGVAFYKNHLIIGGAGFQEVTNSWIMLITLNKEDVQFNSIISHTVFKGLDYDFYFDLPSVDTPKQLQHIGDNGKVELEIDFFKQKFRLYLEIKDNKLQLNYNSKGYKTVFYNTNKDLKKLDDYNLREYIIYGMLIGKFSKNESLKLAKLESKSYISLAPLIIYNAVMVKKLADFLDVTDLVVGYLKGEIDINIIEKLSENNKDFLELFKYLNKLDEALNYTGLDEIAFNDFVAYFLGDINQDDFTKSVENLLSQSNNDLENIINNIYQLNGALSYSSKDFKVEKILIQ